MTLHIALLFAFLAIVAFAVGCLGVSATQPSVHAELTAAEIGSAVKKPTSSWDLSLAIALRFGYSMSIWGISPRVDIAFGQFCVRYQWSDCGHNGKATMYGYHFIDELPRRAV